MPDEHQLASISMASSPGVLPCTNQEAVHILNDVGMVHRCQEADLAQAVRDLLPAAAERRGKPISGDDEQM